jgi:hypothetical protein
MGLRRSVDIAGNDIGEKRRMLGGEQQSDGLVSPRDVKRQTHRSVDDIRCPAPRRSRETA